MFKNIKQSWDNKKEKQKTVQSKILCKYFVVFVFFKMVFKPCTKSSKLQKIQGRLDTRDIWIQGKQWGHGKYSSDSESES